MPPQWHHARLSNLQGAHFKAQGARSRSVTGLLAMRLVFLCAFQLPQLGKERVQVLELAVDGGEAYVSHVVS